MVVSERLLTMLALAFLPACISERSSTFPAPARPETSLESPAALVRTKVTLDIGVLLTPGEILGDTTTIVVAKPVGEPVYEVVTEIPELANYTHEISISRTIYGTATGVIRVGTVGYNPKVSFSPKGPEIEASEFPMMPRLPAGESLFFLREFSGRSDRDVLYGIVGEFRGLVRLTKNPSTGKWATTPNAMVAEFAGRDLDEFARQVQSAMDDLRR